MPYELGLLPSGHLHCFQDLHNVTESQVITDNPAPALKPIITAFTKKSPADGLLTLSTDPSDAGLPPTFRYW
ncbi:MAG: hypothetical protein JKY67_00670, partial [Pseudomonadales bacterium]|nr:hypothetical protein [Pseudomonadales bacterium]